MIEYQSATSAAKFAQEPDPTDPVLAAKLQQAANLANQNCDRATALAHKLSVQLREAQARIGQLELASNELVDRLQSEADAVIAKLQSNADAHVQQSRREARGLVARAEAEARDRVKSLQDELAQAKQHAEQMKAEAKAEADVQIAQIKAEANRTIARAESEARDRIDRLQGELGQAKQRAHRAEQWLVRIREELEGQLMPLFSALHDQLSARN